MIDLFAVWPAEGSSRPVARCVADAALLCFLRIVAQQFSELGVRQGERSRLSDGQQQQGEEGKPGHGITGHSDTVWVEHVCFLWILFCYVLDLLAEIFNSLPLLFESTDYKLLVLDYNNPTIYYFWNSDYVMIMFKAPFEMPMIHSLHETCATTKCKTNPDWPKTHCVSMIHHGIVQA